MSCEKMPSKPAWMTQEREDAIELLLCAADAGWFAANRLADGPPLVEGTLSAVEGVSLHLDVAWRDMYLEAAGLLLDGWNPGDEVVRRQPVRRPVFDVPSPTDVAAYLNGPSMAAMSPKAEKKVAR